MIFQSMQFHHNNKNQIQELLLIFRSLDSKLQKKQNDIRCNDAPQKLQAKSTKGKR